jgi:hypothetical protein
MIPVTEFYRHKRARLNAWLICWFICFVISAVFAPYNLINAGAMVVSALCLGHTFARWQSITSFLNDLRDSRIKMEVRTKSLRFPDQTDDSSD